ncbi:hypothetical protein [Anaerofustis butyriciformans]|uniref:hypothetical protein n=1 Tax=Anaerofustis TaxID=264995 RepID=UPI003F89AF89
MICPKCGYDNNRRNDCCSECGFSLKERKVINKNDNNITYAELLTKRYIRYKTIQNISGMVFLISFMTMFFAIDSDYDIIEFIGTIGMLLILPTLFLYIIFGIVRYIQKRKITKELDN